MELESLEDYLSHSFPRPQKPITYQIYYDAGHKVSGFIGVRIRRNIYEKCEECEEWN